MEQSYAFQSVRFAYHFYNQIVNFKILCSVQNFGNCHIYGKAIQFLAKYGPIILEQNLRNNCKLHFYSLHSVGILKASQIEELCVRLNEMDKKLKTTHQMDVDVILIDD